MFHSVVYFKAFPISYHNVRGKNAYWKVLHGTRLLSHVLQFSEPNELFNNAFQALSISWFQYFLQHIIILLLWQKWLYTTRFLPNKCHLSCHTVSASNFSLVFTTCSTSYQLSTVKTEKPLLQARDLPWQFSQRQILPLAKEVKVQQNLAQHTTQMISHFTYIFY